MVNKLIVNNRLNFWSRLLTKNYAQQQEQQQHAAETSTGKIAATARAAEFANNNLIFIVKLF
jgi:hypothetical protein